MWNASPLAPSSAVFIFRLKVLLLGWVSSVYVWAQRRLKRLLAKILKTEMPPQSESRGEFACQICNLNLFLRKCVVLKYFYWQKKEKSHKIFNAIWMSLEDLKWNPKGLEEICLKIDIFVSHFSDIFLCVIKLQIRCIIDLNRMKPKHKFLLRFKA